MRTTLLGSKPVVLDEAGEAMTLPAPISLPVLTVGAIDSEQEVPLPGLAALAKEVAKIPPTKLDLVNRPRSVEHDSLPASRPIAHRRPSPGFD